MDKVEERTIGFIQGVLYSATMMKRYGLDTYDLIKESGISISDIKKHGEESDIEVLKEELEQLFLQ